MSIIDIGTADPTQRLSKSLKERIAKFNRKALLKLWHVARERSRVPGAYFWRDLKKECWKRLAGAK